MARHAKVAALVKFTTGATKAFPLTLARRQQLRALVRVP
jgi:hypothetical protein